jgi:hypothetical protein
MSSVKLLSQTKKGTQSHLLRCNLYGRFLNVKMKQDISSSFSYTRKATHLTRTSMSLYRPCCHPVFQRCSHITAECCPSGRTLLLGPTVSLDEHIESRYREEQRPLTGFAVGEPDLHLQQSSKVQLGQMRRFDRSFWE